MCVNAGVCVCVGGVRGQFFPWSLLSNLFETKSLSCFLLHRPGFLAGEFPRFIHLLSCHRRAGIVDVPTAPSFTLVLGNWAQILTLIERVLYFWASSSVWTMSWFVVVVFGGREWDEVLLCSPVWPTAQYVDQGALSFTEICLCLSPKCWDNRCLLPNPALSFIFSFKIKFF